MGLYVKILLLSLRFIALSALRLRPFNSFTNVRYEPVASYSTNRQIFLPNTQVTSRFPFLNGEHLTKAFRFTGYPGFETPMFPLKSMSAAASTFDVSLPSSSTKPEHYMDKSKLSQRNKSNFYSGHTKEMIGNNNNNNFPPRKQDHRGVTLDIRGGGYKIEPPRSGRPYKPPSVGNTKHEVRNTRKNNNVNNVGRESSLRPRARRPTNKPPRSGAPPPNQLFQNMNYEQALKYFSPNIEIENPENVLPYNPKLFKQMQKMMQQGAYNQPGNKRDAFMSYNRGVNLRVNSGHAPESYKTTATMKHLPGSEVITPQQYANFANSFASFSPQQLFAQFNSPDTTQNSQLSNNFFSRDPSAQVSAANAQIDQNTYQQLQQTFQQGQAPNLMSEYLYQQGNAKAPENENFNFQMANGQTDAQTSFPDSNAYLQAFYGVNSAASLPTFPGFSPVTTNTEHTNQQINIHASEQSSIDKHNFPAISAAGLFQDQSQLEQANAYLAFQQANAQQAIQPLDEGKISEKFAEAVRNLPSHPQSPSAIALQTPAAYDPATYSKDVHPQYVNEEYSPSYAGNPETYFQSDRDSAYGNTRQISHQSKSSPNEGMNKDSVFYPQVSSYSTAQIYSSNQSLFEKPSTVSDSNLQTYSIDEAKTVVQNSDSPLKQINYSSVQYPPEKLYYQQLGNTQGQSKFEFSAMDTPSPSVFSRPTASRNSNTADVSETEKTEANRKEVGERAALHLSEQMTVFVSENPPNRQFYLPPQEYEMANSKAKDAYGKVSKPDLAAAENKPKTRKSSTRNSEKFAQKQVPDGHGKDSSFDISSGSKTTDTFGDSLKSELVTRNASSGTFHHYKTKYHAPVPASTSEPMKTKRPMKIAPTSPAINLMKTPETTTQIDYSETPICSLHSNTTYCLQDPEYPKEQIVQAIQKNRHPLDRFLLMDSMIGQSMVENLEENTLKSSKSVSYSFEGNVVVPTPEAANNTGTGCSSNTYYAKPLRAINTAGQWKIIVNVEFVDAESNYTQTVRIEECSRKNGFLGSCGGETISACLQQYKLYRLLVWEPNKNFYIDAFLLPISCFCGSQHTSKR